MQGCKDKQICPFFQWNDERCAQRFNLQRLREVFDQCLGDYTACRIYQQRSVACRARPVRLHVRVAAS